MVKRILLSLICILVLLLSACQSPASTSVPAESSTNSSNSSSETNNVPAPTSTSVSKDTPLSAPDIAQEHAQAFFNYASNSIEEGRSWDLIMSSMNNSSSDSYTDLYNVLARNYITGSLLYSIAYHPQNPDFRTEILTYFQGKHPDQLDGVTAFLDSVDAFPDKARLVNEAIQQYGLYPDSPTPTVIVSGFDVNSKYTFNPTDGTNQSTLNFTLNNPKGSKDLPYPFNDQYTIKVIGSLINPNQLVAQPAQELEVVGDAEVDPYNVKIHVKGAVEWANVLILDKNNDVVGYYLAANRRLGAPHLMAMRSLPQDEQGKAMLPWWVYHPDGTVDPTSSTLPSALSANAQLDADLSQAVNFGFIFPEEKQNLTQQFSDPTLKTLIKDDYARAGFILAETFKDLGGDLLLPVLTGQNSQNSPVRIFVDGDPELDSLFAGQNRPNVDPDGGIVWSFNNGTRTFIMGKNLGNGQQPIEVLASLMTHEILVHETGSDSMSEEEVANIAQALAWAKAGQLNPAIYSTNTVSAKGNNLLLYVLLNSLYVDTDQPSPFVSQIGLLSEITGPQIHDQDNYNAWPGSVRRNIKGFVDLIEGLYANAGDSGVDLQPTSAGTDTTRLLFNEMFPDLELVGAEGHPNPDGKMIPDFAQGLPDRLDPLIHNLIPNDQFPQLAQELHMTLDGSNIAP